MMFMILIASFISKLNRVTEFRLDKNVEQLSFTEDSDILVKGENNNISLINLNLADKLKKNALMDSLFDSTYLNKEIIINNSNPFKLLGSIKLNEFRAQYLILQDSELIRQRDWFL